jgi:hypothetical protein
MAKLYVLVRNEDLPKNYQAVQAGHAVAQFCLEHPDKWKNETLVYLRGGDLNQIFDWWTVLCDNKIKDMSYFQEPDIDYEMTAIAVLSNEKTDELFKDMRLV